MCTHSKAWCIVVVRWLLGLLNCAVVEQAEFELLEEEMEGHPVDGNEQEHLQVEFSFDLKPKSLC